MGTVAQGKISSDSMEWGLRKSQILNNLGESQNLCAAEKLFDDSRSLSCEGSNPGVKDTEEE